MSKDCFVYDGDIAVRPQRGVSFQAESGLCILAA